MPTGYTAPVADGKVTDFRTFALSCAREFGALIVMRDAPADAPIPDEFPPDPYYQKRLDGLNDEMRSLVAMDAAQAEAAAIISHEAAVESHRLRREKDAATRERYAAMRQHASDWEPPTPDHRGLRDFMLKQLDDSFQFDCADSEKYDPSPIRKSGAQWKAEKVAEIGRSIEYAEKSAREEAEQSANRTAWIRALRESLPNP